MHVIAILLVDDLDMVDQPVFQVTSGIWGGDLNVVLNPTIDKKKGGIANTKIKSRKILKSIMEEADMSDV